MKDKKPNLLKSLSSRAETSTILILLVMIVIIASLQNNFFTMRTMLSYTNSFTPLILLAMGFVTNVSYIQAFRQMSLPIGVIFGILFLKEKCLPTKLAGVTLVVTGLIITAIA